MVTQDSTSARVGLNGHKVTYLYGSGTKTVKAANLTPMRALRAKCLDCSGGSPMEVKYCVIPECPLWAYRFGKRPEGVESKYLDPDYVKAAGLQQCCDQLVRECGDSFKGTPFYQESQDTIAAVMKPSDGSESRMTAPTCPFPRIDSESDTLDVPA